MRRLGIFGGTFNPIHHGHLILAECAREQFALDRVLFIPTATPPHKAFRELLPGRDRLRLIRLAIHGHPAFHTDDMELARGGVSYSLETVRALHARHPRAKLFFLVGADMLRVRWYGLPELTRLCTFVVASRAAQPLAHRFRGMRRLSMPPVDISSSMIRARARAGASIRYLVPEAVEREIRRRRLFQGVRR